MKLFMITIFILVNSLSCVNNKSSSGGGADSFTSVTDSGQIVGTWQLSSVTIPDELGVVAISGKYYIHFKADHSYVVNTELHSLSYGNTASTTNCTRVSSGEFLISNGEITNSSVKSANISGTCDSTVGPIIVGADDSLNKISISSSQLKITNSFTYLSGGVSKSGDMSYVFTKDTTESWDGSGVDPAYLKTWTQSKYYQYVFCSSLQNTLSKTEISFTGSYTTNIQTASVDYTSTNYLESGDTAACTATASGTVTWGKFGPTTTQTAFSDACLQASATTPILSRNVIGQNGKMYSYKVVSLTNSSCSDSAATAQVIFIYE